MNPFLRYFADKNSAHRHTPMTTRPCGLRRAGNNYESDHKLPVMLILVLVLVHASLVLVLVLVLVGLVLVLVSPVLDKSYSLI